MGDSYQLILIDDEPKVTESLGREIHLEFGEENFTVISFNNPDESLSYIRKNAESVFLVISDLRMPEMNGANLLSQVRESCPDTQTILLTAYTDIDSIQRAISASIQSLLFKPWTRESIVAEITKALDAWKLKKENARLKKRLDEMLESAGEFQRNLFSQRIPEVPGIRFDIDFVPYEVFHCGGDFYNVFDDGNGNLMIILGDVTGHGPKSAMIAGMIKMALDSIIDLTPTLRAMPDKLLTLLNCRLCALFSCSPETLVGLTALYLNMKSRTLAVATAGLPPVAHVRDGSPELLSTPNHMLGAFPETLYYKTERFIHDGDRIFLFTDGLTESVPAFFSLPKDEIERVFTHRNDNGARTVRNDFMALLPSGIVTDDTTVVSIEIERTE